MRRYMVFSFMFYSISDNIRRKNNEIFLDAVRCSGIIFMVGSIKTGKMVVLWGKENNPGGGTSEHFRFRCIAVGGDGIGSLGTCCLAD